MSLLKVMTQKMKIICLTKMGSVLTVINANNYATKTPEPS